MAVGVLKRSRFRRCSGQTVIQLANKSLLHNRLVISSGAKVFLCFANLVGKPLHVPTIGPGTDVAGIDIENELILTKGYIDHGGFELGPGPPLILRSGCRRPAGNLESRR
jgi:hypothetical protein